MTVTDYTPSALLRAEVETRNRVNAETDRLRAKMRELLAPYLGRKVLRGVGSNPDWITKLGPALRALAQPGYRIWFNFGRYAVNLYVDSTYRVSDVGVQYVKQSAYLCGITDGDILDPATPTDSLPLRTDYTAEEVERIRAEIETVTEQLGRLKWEVREFERG
jgi:hypothetical protein